MSHTTCFLSRFDFYCACSWLLKINHETYWG